MKRGFEIFGDSFGERLRLGLLAAADHRPRRRLLFILGLLMFVPAKTHRFLGVIALLISLAACAAVLVPLARSSWDFGAFDLGFWFAIAVPVLGLLGSLKAVLTGPKFATTQPLT